jgi:RNA ligase (TIGR02306 family)
MAVERKLASIQKVMEVLPHPNADSLEIIRVLGWKLCAKKGEFKAGDLCVYCEVDSLLPEKPEFEFLRAKGFRIRTIRLRGEVSQGIAFPVSILGVNAAPEYMEGFDVTGLLGVVKYEPTLHLGLGGEIKGLFPSFLKKTDETRIQSVPKLLERYRGERFYVTEKLDGTSMTVFFNQGEFGVCGRNYELRDTEGNALWTQAKALHLPEHFKHYGRNIAVQGELIGEGIQGNKYKIKGKQFRPFNAIDIDASKRMDAIELFNLCSLFDLESVPLIDFNFILNHSMDELVAYASGKSKLNPTTDREGVVIRWIVEKFDEDIGDLSFKVISPDFLIKHNE